MGPVIPTIRAGALAPILGWLFVHGRQVEKLLEDCGIGEEVIRSPNAPLPVHSALEFLRRLSRAEGPQIFCMIGCTTDPREIGSLGELARSRPTPRWALHSVATSIPRHCTHLNFAVEDHADGIRVTDSWAIPIDSEGLHAAHTYAAALLIGLCASTGAAPPLLHRVEITPHPTAGLDHLRRWFRHVEAATAPRLVVDIPASVADARFQPGPARAFETPSDWGVLREGQDFGKSVRWTIGAMLGTGVLSVGEVASAAGMTRRTLQRRLSEANLTFAMLVDETRRDAALRLPTSGDTPLGEVAARVGFANPSALTRAVRRWTGTTPVAIRETAMAERTHQTI